MKKYRSITVGERSYNYIVRTAPNGSYPGKVSIRIWDAKDRNRLLFHFEARFDDPSLNYPHIPTNYKDENFNSIPITPGEVREMILFANAEKMNSSEVIEWKRVLKING